MDTGEETPEHERTLVRRMLPLLRGAMEGTEGGKPGEFRSLMDVLLDLGEETAGGLSVAGLRLAVAAVKLDKVILRQVQRAGSARYTDFKQWVVDHLSGGAGALHKFSNKDNQVRCVLDEVHRENGTLCSAEELMQDRIATWTGLWGERDSPECCEKVGGNPAGLAP